MGHPWRAAVQQSPLAPGRSAKPSPCTQDTFAAEIESTIIACGEADQEGGAPGGRRVGEAWPEPDERPSAERRDEQIGNGRLEVRIHPMLVPPARRIGRAPLAREPGRVQGRRKFGR